MLLLSKVRDFENSGSVSGAYRERISLSQSEAQKDRLTQGRDREQIRSRSGAYPSHSCNLSEPIRGSESQSGSPSNPLPIPSLEDSLPKVMWPLWANQRLRMDPLLIQSREGNRRRFHVIAKLIDRSIRCAIIPWLLVFIELLHKGFL